MTRGPSIITPSKGKLMTKPFSPNGVRPSSIPYEPEDESDCWFRLHRWRKRCSLAAPKHTALLMRIEEGSRGRAALYHTSAAAIGCAVASTRGWRAVWQTPITAIRFGSASATS
jgi:hypothetical protein